MEKGLKKSLKKRMAAAVLSVAMAVTAGFAGNGRLAVSAASKQTSYVGLRTTFKTLKVHQTNKMTLKNNTKSWKITKVATEDRSIAMVYEKTASDFMIKGKSEGKTKVKARLKTTVRKKYNSKLVKCTVKVIPQNQDHTDDPAQTPVTETSKNVSTQAELDEALANPNLTAITIDTKEKQHFTIQAGDHSGVVLTIKAPASDIENHAVFRSIDIQEIAKNTWHENAAGNTLRILASAARIVVGPGGVIRDISFTKPDANVKLVVNGKVEKATIQTKVTIEISSDLEQKPTVPLIVDGAAQGSNITAQTPLDLTVRAADTVVNIEKGAEGSKVKADVKTTVKNNSSGSISVTDAKNNTQQVRPGASSVVNANVSVYVPSGGSSSLSQPSVSYTYYTVSFNGKEVRVREGDKVNESDIPTTVKRNGDGYRFSGWYYADGKDDAGNTKYTKFDLTAAITRDIALVGRFGMTEADRVLDVRGRLFVTSGSAVTVDLTRSYVTVAIFDEDESAAGITKINDQAVMNAQKELEVQPKDGKLQVIIQLHDLSRRFSAEIPLPEDAQAGKEIDLSQYVWSYYKGESITVSSQEELDQAMADHSYDSIQISTPGAIRLTIGRQNRQDAVLYVNAPQAEIENYAVFQGASIQDRRNTGTWTEHAKGNVLWFLHGTPNIVVAEDAEVKGLVFNWGGDGNLVVNGTVHEIGVGNDQEPDDTKEVKINISGATQAKIPFFMTRRDGVVTTSIPLAVTIYDTAPRTTIHFEQGSGGSTVLAYVEAVIHNNSGQEIIFKEGK